MAIDPETTRALAAWLTTFLIHSSLWILSTCWLARAVRSPRWRARLWRGAVLGGLASTGLALHLDSSRLAWHWEAPPRDAAAALDFDPTAPAPPVLGLAVGTFSQPDPVRVAGMNAGVAPTTEHRALDWIAAGLALWSAGALLGLVRLGRAHRALARVLRDRRALRDGPLAADLARLARRARPGRKPRLRPKLSVSQALTSPIALARDEIVVPERALQDLALDEQEALIAHEMAHLLRRDPHWLLALAVLERLLWFQPLLRLARNRSLAAAELCCDDEATRWTGSELALARCLAEVASWVGPRPPARLAVGMAAGPPSALLERVERLLAPRATARFQGLLVASFGGAMLAGLACSGPTLGEAPDVAQGAAPAKESPPKGPIQAQLVAAPRKSETIVPRVGEVLIEVPMSAERLRERLDEQKARRASSVEDEGVTHALEVLDGCPEAGVAFHVALRDGTFADQPSLASEHAFELRADGSIWCGDMPLFRPDREDERLLRFHLAEIARCMPKASPSATFPGTPALAEGTLELRIDSRAPQAGVQRTLEACGRREVQIWKFSLVHVSEGKAKDSIPYALPRDLPLQVKENQPVPPGPTELQIHSMPIEGERAIEYVLRSQDAQEGASGRTRSTAELVLLLAVAYRTAGDRPLVIDALPGTLYGDVSMVIDLVVEAGFTDIRFVGRR